MVLLLGMGIYRLTQTHLSDFSRQIKKPKFSLANLSGDESISPLIENHKSVRGLSRDI
jgi:hypothetical protein